MHLFYQYLLTNIWEDIAIKMFIDFRFELIVEMKAAQVSCFYE